MGMLLVHLLIAVLVSPLVAVVSRRGAQIHYKTTYACEGNPLHLHCEEDRHIHLVRANYGRFSISICNDGGRLDWSVNCMSYRSFLFMQDRCSHKSNCSVVVSSKMFGDPCPGTLKYLEVQYHCAHSRSSSTTRRPPTLQINIPTIQPPNSNSNNNNRSHSSSLPSGEPGNVLTNEDVIPYSGADEGQNLDNQTRIRNGSKPFSPPGAGFPQSSSTSTIASSSSTTTTEETNGVNGHLQTPKSARAPSESTDISIKSIPGGRKRTNVSKADANKYITVAPLASMIPPYISSSTTPSPSPHPQTVATLDWSDYCPPIFVRSIFWNYTRFGENAVQKCPGGASGLVRWHCSSELGSWYPERPDFRECRSKWLDLYEDRLNKDVSVLAIARDLNGTTLTKPIFGEDLERIAGVIHEILSRIVVSMEGFVETIRRREILKELLTFIVETVSNLLDNAQDDAWLDLDINQRRYVAFKLLEGLQENALLLAENSKEDGIFTVAKPNVLVAVHVLDTRMPISLQFPTAEDTEGTVWVRMEDSLLIPAQALREYSKQGFAKAAFLAYNRVEDLLKPESVLQDYKLEEESGSKLGRLLNYSSSNSLVINSRVIGASLSGKSELDTANIALSQPVTIVLKHIQEENVSRPKCVYWNKERRGWLSNGCWVESTNSTHTTCLCNHLTHFALLMDSRPYQVVSDNYNWFNLITTAGCVTTALCLWFMLVILCTINGDNSEALQIRRNLCSTLIIAEVTFLFGIDQTSYPLFCGIIAGILQFFLLASFLWTFLESFDLYLLAYGGPLVIIVVSVCIDPRSYGTKSFCWLRADNYFCFSFVGPAIGIVFGSMAFILISAFILFNKTTISDAIKGKEQFKVNDIKCSLKWILILLCIQAATWTTFLLYLNIPPSSSFFAISFTIFNIILGFFLIIYCTALTESVQHHKFVQFIPVINWMIRQKQDCTAAKGSVVHSTAYGTSTLPVVTQVATQVSGIMSSPSGQPISNTTSNNSSSSNPPMMGFGSGTSQIPSSHLQPWSSSPEKNNLSTAPDHRFTAAPEREDLLSTTKGTTGPILVNPVRDSVLLDETLTDIYKGALKNPDLQDYECKMHQIRNNSLTRAPKSRRKARHQNVHQTGDGNPRYTLYTDSPSVNQHLNSNSNLPKLNHFIDHIYESIDSDSAGSYISDRFYPRKLGPVSKVNDFYAGASVHEDEWSQNSSSSYGPLYDDRPLLVGSPNVNESNSNTNATNSITGNISFNYSHAHGNLYEKSRLVSPAVHPSGFTTRRGSDRGKNLTAFFLTRNQLENQQIHMPSEAIQQQIDNTEWNTYSGSSGLPDLLQYPCDSQAPFGGGGGGTGGTGEEGREERREAGISPKIDKESQQHQTGKCMQLPTGSSNLDTIQI